MQFISVQFFITFIAILLAQLVLKKETHKQISLLIFSYFIYAYWDYRFLAILVMQTIIAYSVGRIMNQKGKYPLAIGVVLTVSTLFYFKYLGFFLENINLLFGSSKSMAVNLLIPVGISFYTLQSISYMVDVYRKKLDPQPFYKVALYIGFFPQLVSGHILKAHFFIPQLDKKHEINKEDFILGLQIFINGAVKKHILADYLGVCVDAVYNSPTSYSWYSVLIAVISYSFQIYYDFSGYSDMAIGVARMLGYDLGKNFNCPYLSENPAEFWNRWHISLSSWFKEYVYFSLGGNRKGLTRTMVNLFVVMLVSGLWHGAQWTFIIWGALHGIALIMHGLYKARSSSTGKKESANLLSIFINFVFVTLLWVPFRADSMASAYKILRQIVLFRSGISYAYVYAIVIIIFSVARNFNLIRCAHGTKEYVIKDYRRFSSWFILWSEIMALLAFYYIGGTQFIYSQF